MKKRFIEKHRNKIQALLVAPHVVIAAIMIGVLVYWLAGCSGPDEVREYLESQGMTNIRFRGYDLFSCESKHIYAHRFAAETDGVDNLVIVCAEDGFKNPETKVISSKFTKGNFR